MFRVRRASAALLLILATMCSGPRVQAVIHHVELSDVAIAPAVVILAPGDSVRWLVTSGRHQLHSDTDSFKSWDSGPLDAIGATFILPIQYHDGPGPFLYLCLVDAHRGEIHVADSCSATGPVGGSGTPTVADLTYALRVVAGDVPPPDDLYRFDLSGDCVVNELDAQLLAKWFTFGISSLPEWPVLTCCHPELVPACLVSLTGDIDASGQLTAADIIHLAGYVFMGLFTPLPCPAAADVNCSRTVSSADIIGLVNHIFKGAPPPCDVCDMIPDVWTCP